MVHGAEKFRLQSSDKIVGEMSSLNSATSGSDPNRQGTHGHLNINYNFVPRFHDLLK